MIAETKKNFFIFREFVVAILIASAIPQISSLYAIGEELDSGESNHFLEVSWKAAQESEVVFATVAAGEIKETTPLLGEVSLNEETLVRVRPRFAGTVKSVLKRQGDEVASGDVLAVIQSNESLAPYQVKAEAKGKIIGKNIVQGEFVKDDQEIFTIANLSYVWINAAAYESVISDLRVGMPVIVKSGTRHTSQESAIDYIDAFLLRPSRSQNVRIIVNNTRGEWIPGMFVTVEVIIDRKVVPCAVPTVSVSTIDGKPHVFVQMKQGDKEGVEVREVTLGRSDADLTEIKTGVTPGEKIATANLFVLKAELDKGSAD